MLDSRCFLDGVQPFPKIYAELVEDEAVCQSHVQLSRVYQIQLGQRVICGCVRKLGNRVVRAQVRVEIEIKALTRRPAYFLVFLTYQYA